MIGKGKSDAIYSVEIENFLKEEKMKMSLFDDLLAQLSGGVLIYRRVSWKEGAGIIESG